MTLTASVSWYSAWRARCDEAEGESDVGTELWLDHLCLTVNCLIYYWSSRNRGDMYELPAPQKLTDFRSGRNIYLRYCDSCSEVTFHTSVFEHEGMKYQCEGCSSPRWSTDSQVPEDLYTNTLFDRTLFVPADAPLSLKQEMTVSLVALGRWRSLDPAIQNDLEPVLGGGSIGYSAALIFVAVDLAVAPVDGILALGDRADRYYNRCPTLQGQVATNKWRRMVASAFATWLKRGWLTKVDTGIYRRINRDDPGNTATTSGHA